MDEDWDNIIILDACRYDQFNQLSKIEGELQSRTSLGSSTPEFLRKNFKGKAYHDTVYVTANPQYRKVGLDNCFHDVVDVWESDWDEKLNTVKPDDVKEKAIQAYNKYPNKRIVVHFMQPHYPFIGDIGKEISGQSSFGKFQRKTENETDSAHRETIWKKLEQGTVDEEIVRKSYDENLKIVFPSVQQLVKEFEEHTVITSDHGNLLGERVFPLRHPLYGHPSHVYTEQLRKVPWLIQNRDINKDVINERSISKENTDPEVVQDRLKHLGYK